MVGHIRLENTCGAQLPKYTGSSIPYDLIDQSKRAILYTVFVKTIKLKQPDFDTLWIVYTNSTLFQNEITTVLRTF